MVPKSLVLALLLLSSETEVGVSEQECSLEKCPGMEGKCTRNTPLHTLPGCYREDHSGTASSLPQRSWALAIAVLGREASPAHFHPSEWQGKAAARCDVPPPCVFPFIYKQKSYSSCTKDGINNGMLWCATTANYDKSPQWKYCSLKEYDGNSGGKPCVFPFTYKSRTFYTCTNEDAQIGRFWCATTGSYDKDKQWSYCADTRLAAHSQGTCIFPFIYKGKSYSSCTTAGESSGKLWCSLTSNYDADPRWTYCNPSEPRPCKFPFIFQGKSYSECTKEGSADGQLWCAITDNYDRDSKWKACSIQEYEGSSKGQVCVFPFIYNGKTFKTCTNENSSDRRFWCATTENYDKDKKWSYCADTRLGPYQPCIFPFTYNGKSYSSCTADGESSGKLWCSLTSNYNVERKWMYCST